MLLGAPAMALSTTTSMQSESTTQSIISICSLTPFLELISMEGSRRGGAAQAGRALPTSGGIATGRQLLPHQRLPAEPWPQGGGGGRREPSMFLLQDRHRIHSIQRPPRSSLLQPRQRELALMVSRASTLEPPLGCHHQHLLVTAHHPHQLPLLHHHAQRERSQTEVSTDHQGAAGAEGSKSRATWV